MQPPIIQTKLHSAAKMVNAVANYRNMSIVFME